MVGYFEKEFRALLNKYGVYKCYISPDYKFDPYNPYGVIDIPKSKASEGLWSDLYNLLIDDDVEDSESFLLINPVEDSQLVCNYDIRGGFY